MNIYKRKNKGFTILEVLFAIVILSFALSTIFILLNNMFKIVHRVKELSLNIDKTPLIYSASSPFIHYKNIENYKSDFFPLPQYNKTILFNQEQFIQFTTTFIASLNQDEDDIKKKFFSNIIFIPLKQNNKEKNES